jgi:hypothetical protein
VAAPRRNGFINAANSRRIDLVIMPSVKLTVA